MLKTVRVAQTLSLLIAADLLSACAAQVAARNQSAAMERGAPEMCFGIARGGHNDCRTAAHVCAGWARKDRDAQAFVYVPSGTCKRIAGGRVGTASDGALPAST